jgi:RNA polymerase sigma-54 factor
MYIGLQQKPIQTQTLIMTPQLQMAIKLLQLSRMELAEKVRQELNDNPTLEDLGESGLQIDGSSQDRVMDGIDRQIQLEMRSNQGATGYESETRESVNFENFTANSTTLGEHLLWQLLMTAPTEEEKKIGSLITGNLNDDGYLKISTDEIAEVAAASPNRVEQVLNVMQGFDPSGVCARDLKESLLLQVRHCGIGDSRVAAIIIDHLHHLEKNNYKAICRAMKIPIDDIQPLIDIIKNLDPKPGRNFGGAPCRYNEPDVFVYRQEGEFVISLNNAGMPRLRINPLYRKYAANRDKITGEDLAYLREKIQSAAWLIKSIHQRQRTLYRVMESILKFQRGFFENGISQLKPLILRDVAEDIEMAEATVSRVTTSKYVQCPRGLFSLKYFFNSSVNRIQGDPIASICVQEKIKTIVAAENLAKPLSDEKITEILRADNIDIARRTVAKYREAAGIPGSFRRKIIAR